MCEKDFNNSHTVMVLNSVIILPLSFSSQLKIQKNYLGRKSLHDPNCSSYCKSEPLHNYLHDYINSVD